MVRRIAVRKVFSRQTRDLECFADRYTITWRIRPPFFIQTWLQQYSRSSLKYANQLSRIFQYSHCTVVTILFRLFIQLFINLSVRKRALIAKLTTRFRFMELTFGRMAIITRWFGANTFQVISAWLSSELPRWTPASEVLFPRCTSASLCWWFRGCERFWINISVTPAFPWICAGISGCEQPLEIWNRGKRRGWSAGCFVRSKRHRERDEITSILGTQSGWPWATDVVQGTIAMWYADKVCICTCCVRGVTVHTFRRLPGNWKLPASEKQLLNKRKCCRNHLMQQVSLCWWFRPKNFFTVQSPGWRSPIIPTLIRLPIVVLRPLRGSRRTCWRMIFPSSSRLNRVCVLLGTFKLLSIILSCLVCWMELIPSPVLSACF